MGSRMVKVWVVKRIILELGALLNRAEDAGRDEVSREDLDAVMERAREARSGFLGLIDRIRGKG